MKKNIYVKTIGIVLSILLIMVAAAPAVVSRVGLSHAGDEETNTKKSEGCPCFDDCNPFIRLPNETVSIKLRNPGPTSYFATNLSNVPEGYDVSNGMYSGWCSDLDHTIAMNRTYNITLYSSYNDTLPSHLYHPNWSKV